MAPLFQPNMSILLMTVLTHWQLRNPRVTQGPLVMTHLLVILLMLPAQEASAPGDCILNHSGLSLTSLTNALFTHVFPQFSMPEHKYVLDLITMGQSLCKSFLKQGVLTKQQCAFNELNLLQDALPSMVLLNGCTAHIDGDPNCPQLKLNTNGKSLNAVLDTGAKVSLINKQLFDQIPCKCKTALCPSILQLQTCQKLTMLVYLISLSNLATQYLPINLLCPKALAKRFSWETLKQDQDSDPTPGNNSKVAVLLILMVISIVHNSNLIPMAKA